MWFVSWWLRVLRRAIMSKRPGMLLDGIILLHDNARPHTVNLVRDKLERSGWETVQHPPYSPDLSPCDSRFWRPEERHSWTSVSSGRGSARVGEVVDPTSFYKTGIDSLVSQWDTCINTSGNYVWIKQIPLSLFVCIFDFFQLFLFSLKIKFNGQTQFYLSTYPKLNSILLIYLSKIKLKEPPLVMSFIYDKACNVWAFTIKRGEDPVVHFLVAEGAAMHHEVKMPWNSVGQNHTFAW